MTEISPIQVTYKSTKNAFTASRWLHNLPDIFAADFETAIKYTPEEIQSFKDRLLEEDVPKKEVIALNAKIKATPLGHPSHCTITHLSVAASDSEAYVFILDNKAITSVVLNFLVTTDKTQIWHNLSYDMRFINYFTGKFVNNYEDTQILAKTIINHVDTFKAKTGLKDLAGRWYGGWGIDSTLFDLSSMYDPKMLLYAATDACATYKLWDHLQTFINISNKEYMNGN